MKRNRNLFDIGLIGASMFAATSLLGASAMTLTRAEPASNSNEQATPISWEQAQAALMPAVAPEVKSALQAAATGAPRPAVSNAGPSAPGAPRPPSTAAPQANRVGDSGATRWSASAGDPAVSASSADRCAAGGDHAGMEGGQMSDEQMQTMSPPPGCPAGDGLVYANSPARTPRERAKVFGDPTGSSGWEINYEAPAYAEDGCGASPADAVSESCTMAKGPALREGDPKEYYTGMDMEMPDCRVTPQLYATGMELAQRTREVVGSTYDNKPWMALQNGYTPYPVPGTKTFHLFKSANYGDRNPDGSQVIFDPNAPEMFTYGMTDEGLKVVNVVYAYTGTEEELPDDRKAEWYSMLPRPLGCMAEWHPHFEGVEGPATGNLDGRAFMTHVWTYPRSGEKWSYGDGQTYEGPYPYGEYGDGSEPHAWFTPLKVVPALCNKDGGCI